MYKNQNDSLSNFQHDWSQFLLHFKNTITQPPNTTYEPNGNNISPENRYSMSQNTLDECVPFNVDTLKGTDKNSYNPVSI